MARTFGPCGEITVQSTGGDIVDSISFDSVASSSTGVLFNIPVASDRRGIITALVPTSSTETNMEIKFGTRVIYSGPINDSPSSSSLTLMQTQLGTSTNEYQGSGHMLELKGDYGEDIIITKTSGSTTSTIYLSYKIAY